MLKNPDDNPKVMDVQSNKDEPLDFGF